VTNGELPEVILEINSIRKTLPPRTEYRNGEFLRSLSSRLTSSRLLRSQPAVQAFAADCLTFEDHPRLVETKGHINYLADNHIFSLFDARYFPALSLDYLSYRTLPVDRHLASRYASNTMAVNIEQKTAGFASRVTVALFPENHIDGLQQGDDLIFYFIDKFVERHVRLTRLLINEAMAKDAFPRVRVAGTAEVERASCWWVRLHEYHHRQGDMPIPAFLDVKRMKPLAGLEELRVDVSGMLACLHDAALPRQDALLAYEYMLAERLLRYAVEGIPRPNYDAVASQLLFNYLIQAGGIYLSNNRIHLGPDLPAVLASFLEEIHIIEACIQSESRESVKGRLLEFTNQYTDYDAEARDYLHIPYFAELKHRLAV
jgi:Family of unknown function (DUF6421)